MSVKESVEAKCPACGEESSTTIWRSMNVTQDPDAKELLLAGTVNVERKFCVQYYPYERLADDGFLANFTIDAEPALVVPEGMRVKSEMDYMTHPHIVFEMGELVRYVAFRDRLHELAGGSASGE
jgi:RNA polymerase subunit RPABC4/transcription elongation factor Spt4